MTLEACVVVAGFGVDDSAGQSGGQDTAPSPPQR
jgi:hypothetical protein